MDYSVFFDGITFEVVLPNWEIKQKLELASGLLTGVGVVFN